MNSPTQRSLKYLRDNGYIACMVEKWLPPRGTMKFGRRVDVFGFGDILAMKCEGPEREILLVQATTRANLNARVEKMRGIVEVDLWRRSGGNVAVHGWSKKGPRGKRKTWQVEVIRWG